MSETKTPTAQDIEGVRAMLVTHLMSGLNKTPETVRQIAGLLDMAERVFDAASAHLADDVTETVPTPAPAPAVEDVPQVEPPEDVGDGDGCGAWIPWAGGECPVEPGVFVEVVLRDGRLLNNAGRMLLWAHLVVTPPAPGDIVRYRIVQSDDEDEQDRLLVDKIIADTDDPVLSSEEFEAYMREPDEPAPPQTPTERVAAMTNPQVEAFVTGEGVGDWAESRTPGPTMWRPWSPAWAAVTTDGQCWPAAEGFVSDGQTGDTTTPEGRAECTRRLAVHLLAAKEASNG